MGLLFRDLTSMSYKDLDVLCKAIALLTQGHSLCRFLQGYIFSFFLANIYMGPLEGLLKRQRVVSLVYQ